MFSFTLVFLNFIFLNAFVAWTIFWEFSGRGDFCLGNNPVFDKSFCLILNQPLFSLLVFSILLWSTFSTLIVYLSSKIDYRRFLLSRYRFDLTIIVILLLVSPFQLSFCLGFLGCTFVVYFWHHTVPFSLALLTLVIFLSHAKYKSINKAQPVE
jgi:hypothetical protein